MLEILALQIPWYQDLGFSFLKPKKHVRNSSDSKNSLKFKIGNHTSLFAALKTVIIGCGHKDSSARESTLEDKICEEFVQSLPMTHLLQWNSKGQNFSLR